MNIPVNVTNRTTYLALQFCGFSITRSISQTFATASVTLRKTADIRMGDIVDITGVTQFLFSGIVVSLDFDDGEQVEVGLESAAGILARSDAEPTDWTNNTAKEMIDSICGDFEIDIKYDKGVKASSVPAGVNIDPGTRALAAIVDACHRNGWILLDDPSSGYLVVTTVGSESYSNALVRGLPPVNSIKLSVQDNRTNMTRANRQIPGKARRGKKLIKDIDLWGEAIDATARAGTRRYLRSDTAATVQELGYLAAATALSEGAGGVSISATVSGLLSLDLTQWEPNRRIAVIDPVNSIDLYPALIESVTMTQTADNSQATSLVMVPPAKYATGDAVTAGTLIDPFAGLRIWR